MTTFFSVHFEYRDCEPIYFYMLKALEKSISENSPASSFLVHTIKEPAKSYGYTDIKKSFDRGLVANCIKFDQWVEFIAKESILNPGSNIVLIDCDTVLLGPVNNVFEVDFDICYTQRTTRFPMNGGVIFVKATPAAVEFMKEWRKNNVFLINNPREHRAWMTHWGGINQSSFGKTLIEKKFGTALIERVPGSIYNACDLKDWQTIGNHTKILHVKSELREAVFNAKYHPLLERAKNIYLKYL